MAQAGGSLAIVLGASAWPEYPSFETLPAFQNSANFFRDYVLRDIGLGISPDNLLWLFDDDDQPAKIIDKIKRFLRTRSNDGIGNIFFFYVGHGGYNNKDYFVALRCTNKDNRDLTVLPIRFVAKALYQETPDKRHIIIMDACYASGAVGEFVYQDAGAVVSDVQQQIRDVLTEVDADRGSALFCSAGPKEKAKAPWESEYTMFSGALQRVLFTGDPELSEYLSLEEVASLVERDIFNTFRAEAVRPELHTPKQERGDIRSVRLFPNPAKRKEAEARNVIKLRADLDELVSAASQLKTDLEAVRTSLGANTANHEANLKELKRQVENWVDSWSSSEKRLVKMIEGMKAAQANALSEDPSRFETGSRIRRQVSFIEDKLGEILAGDQMQLLNRVHAQATVGKRFIYGCLFLQLSLFAIGVYQKANSLAYLPHPTLILAASCIVGALLSICLLAALVVSRRLEFALTSGETVDPVRNLRRIKQSIGRIEDFFTRNPPK